MRYRLCSLIVMALIVLQGCAVTHPFHYDKPDVSVTSVRLVNSDSLAPQFEITLFISNPNDKALPLKGIAYSVILENFKVLSGVTNQLPTINAYAQEEIKLLATANLLSGLRLITKLLQTDTLSQVEYSLDAKLDIGTLLPAIYVNETGKLTIGPS
ncbi:LEA type 2 family protein [Neptunomonas phycophila]|uniref:LEA type 2 family protein n=2 Tax=Neptunomonas TaxID=75687 RepID=UPI00351160F2